MKSVDALYVKVWLGVDDRELGWLIADGVLRPAYWAVGGREPFFDLGHVSDVVFARVAAMREELGRLARES